MFGLPTLILSRPGLIRLFSLSLLSSCIMSVTRADYVHHSFLLSDNNNNNDYADTT